MPKREGFGKGIIVRDYPGTRNGFSLLGSFYFRFEKPGSSAPVDNHTDSILKYASGNYRPSG